MTVDPLLPILPILWTSVALVEEFLESAPGLGDAISISLQDGGKEQTIARIPVASARAVRPLLDSFAHAGIAKTEFGDFRLRIWAGRRMRRSLVVSAAVAHGSGPSAGSPSAGPTPDEATYCHRCALAEVTQSRLRALVHDERRRRTETEAAGLKDRTALAALEAKVAERARLVKERGAEVTWLRARAQQYRAALDEYGIPVPEPPAVHTDAKSDTPRKSRP